MTPLVLLLAAVVAQPVGLSADDVDVQARQMFRSLMSPYCPGSLLADCPSSQAAALRDSVRARLGRGQSAARIRDDLVDIYGDEILAAPPFEGLGSLTWLGAGVIFLGGLGLAAGWMRRRLPRSPERLQSPAADDLQRLRRELDAQE